MIRSAWNFSTKGRNATGFNAFTGANVSLRRAGEPVMLCIGLGEEILMNFTAEPGISSGEINCSFSAPESGCHVTLFARQEVEPGIKSPFKRYDTGSDPVSPFIITGLESGSQYYIYAVVTDEQYDTALTVSQSVAALTIAG